MLHVRGVRLTTKTTNLGIRLRGLTIEEFGKRRRTNSCMNCSEVGHKFNGCPKPKHLLLQNVIDSKVSMTRTPISELSSFIHEYCVIKLNSNYPLDSVKHHSNNAFVLNREVKCPPQIGCNIDTLLTSIESALSLNLEDVSKDVPHPKYLDFWGLKTRNPKPETRNPKHLSPFGSLTMMTLVGWMR